MSQFGDNPYLPPQSMPSKPTGFSGPVSDFGSQPLATRWQRFAGSLIDTLVLLIGIIPLSALAGVFLAFVYPQYLETESSSTAVQIIENVVILMFIIVVFLLLNGYLLTHRGQTVGKYVMNTRIVSEDDELVPLPRVFLMRYLVVWLIALIPIVGNLFNLANALAIFRENCKCLHDDICKTKVVMVGSRS